MSVEIVYYNTQPSDWLSERLAVFGDVNVASGENRREFLIALSSAVSKSNITVTVGAITALASTLSKGLGLPLEAVDWARLGIIGDQDVMLPHGALPLMVDGCIYGMIIESASQCIIAVDDEPSALQYLTDNYVVPYIQAITAQQTPPVEEPVEEPIQESEEEQELEEIAQQLTQEPQEIEEPESTPVDEVDLFADIDSDGFLDIEPQKKKHSVLIAFICVLLVLAIGAVGGYIGYTKWWLPKQSDDALEAARKAYTTSLENASEVSLPADYSVKFASLYAENSDVIGWLKVSGLGIDTPIVTAVLHSEGYYDTHLFDGQNNPYGTPYIKHGYDAVVNINPNLVVYGANMGDGRAFSRLEELLNPDSLSKVKGISTDSVLYGDEQWDIISVMLVSADGKDYDYTDNLRQLTLADRMATVKNAVERSKVATGYSASDFDSMEYNDSFLTLVTPYSEDDSKVVVVMATGIDTDNGDTPSQEDGETSSDPVSDEAVSSAAQ